MIISLAFFFIIYIFHGKNDTSRKNFIAIEPFLGHICNLHFRGFGSRCGLLVNAQNSRSSGPGLSPGWGHNVLFSWARPVLLTLTSSQCLSPLRCIKRLPGNLLLEVHVALWWFSVPSRGK